MSDMTDRLHDKRDECEAACSSLWVSEGDCNERMLGVNKNLSSWWEVAKIVIIPVFTAIIVFVSMQAEVKSLKVAMEDLKTVVYTHVIPVGDK
jgi:hypothetical protein